MAVFPVSFLPQVVKTKSNNSEDNGHMVQIQNFGFQNDEILDADAEEQNVIFEEINDIHNMAEIDHFLLQEELSNAGLKHYEEEFDTHFFALMSSVGYAGYFDIFGNVILSYREDLITDEEPTETFFRILSDINKNIFTIPFDEDINSVDSDEDISLVENSFDYSLKGKIPMIFLVFRDNCPENVINESIELFGEW